MEKNPEQAYIIIEEAAELIDVEVFHYEIDIENVYGEEIYNEHKKEWEDFKRMIKPILQISSALRLMMELNRKKNISMNPLVKVLIIILDKQWVNSIKYQSV